MQVISESWDDENGARHEIIDKLVAMESKELAEEFNARYQNAQQLAAQLGHQLEVREARRIGRNDPCPCGSGAKFKKCCGKRLAADDKRVKD